MSISLPPILLVDDDDNLRGLIADELRAAGYQVNEASDGYDALAQCLREAPWLIITDCAMPRMTGPELLARLAADHRFAHVPAIVVSGTMYAPPSTRIAGFIAKPFSVERLLALVRACAVTAHPLRRRRHAS